MRAGAEMDGKITDMSADMRVEEVDLPKLKVQQPLGWNIANGLTGITP